MADRRSSDRCFLERLKSVSKEDPNGLGEPIRGLCGTPTTTLRKAAKELKDIVEHIEQHAEAALEFAASTPPPPHVTRDGVAAVHLLTQAWPPTEQSLFSMINDRLRDTNRASLERFLPLLKLLLVTLSSWEATNVRMWRGVDNDVSCAFKEGQRVLWWGFSTGTRKKQSLEKVLGNDRNCTLFEVNTVRAHLIGNYTERQDPDEVLLGPGAFLEVEEVETVTNAEGMLTSIVHMRDTVPMLKAMDYPI